MKRKVDREDLYVELPRRFHDATRRGEINGRQYLLGCFLAGEVHFKTGEVSLTLRALADSCDWQWSDRTLLRDLHVLRPAWIEFQVGQGQRRPYVFSLTGLRRRETAVRHDFDTETPSSDEVTSTPLEVESASIPQPERVSASSQLRHGDSPKKRREETKQDETTTRSEEKLDHVLGETTTRETIRRSPIGWWRRWARTTAAIDF